MRNLVYRAGLFLGWLWLPLTWVRNGCFEWPAARECVRQGWLDLIGKPPVAATRRHRCELCRRMEDESQ